MRNEGLTKNIMFSMQPALLYSSLVMSLSIVFNIISVSRLRPPCRLPLLEKIDRGSVMDCVETITL